MTASIEETIVVESASVWDALREEAFPDYLTCCILATRAIVEVGHYFGVRVAPVAVGVSAFNAEAWRLVEARVPQSEWPEEAWSVGVEPRPDPGPSTPFSAHLIAETDSFLVDLSARQLGRPDRSIDVFGPLVLRKPPGFSWDRNEVALVTNATETTTVVYRRVRERNYRRAPDWRRNYDRVASPLIRHVREVVESPRRSS